MSFEFRESHERLRKAQVELAKGITAQRAKVCGTCGTGANQKGKCLTCGRDLGAPAAKPPQDEKPDVTPEEVRKAEALRAFYSRYEKQCAEREQEAQSRGTRSLTVNEALASAKPSRADILREKFMTRDGFLREM